MLTFSSFEFYRDVFNGKLSEDDYNGFVIDANAEIKSQINGRSVPAEMMDAVKLCECALVDLASRHKKSSEMLPDDISSVSNDDFKVTRGGSCSDLTKVRNGERRDVCVRFLQTPINLMYRGM